MTKVNSGKMQFLVRVLQLTVILVALVTVSACGGSSSDGPTLSNNACSVLNLGSRALRIINGTECSGLESSPVVRIETFDPRTSARGQCSGTMIRSDVVLTARHCFNSFPPSVTIRYGEYATSQTVPATRVVLHPQYFESTEAAFNDVALVFLQSSVNLPTVPILLSSAVEAGDIVSIFGYGRSEIGSSSINNQELRSGEMLVAQVTDNHVRADFNGEGSNTCQGDSGGPMIKQVNGVGSIIGLTSSGVNIDCGEGDQSLFTNLQSESVIDFITANVANVPIS